MATITRAGLEAVLVSRCGKKLALVGKDGVTRDGTNADLDDPIAEGLRSVGLSGPGPWAIADDRLGQLKDVAELRTLEDVLGNMDQPDQMADTDNQQWLGKFYDSLERTIARKRAQIKDQYGYGLGPIRAGTTDLGFAQTLDEWC